MTIRLNKFISDSGLCSRREADRHIAAGRVRVNGEVAALGVQVGPDDRVEVDGRLVSPAATERPVYLAYHKPVGIICTTDARVPDNIIQAIGHPRRIFPIGRLDVASEGLILLTSDGDVVNKILRAGNAHEKEYEVTVDRRLEPLFLEQMARGVPLPELNTVTLPCRVHQETSRRFTLILTQGLNRQIRRMCEALGYQAVRLRRTRIINVRLGALPLGAARELAPVELAELKRLISSSTNAHAGESGDDLDAD